MAEHIFQLRVSGFVFTRQRPEKSRVSSFALKLASDVHEAMPGGGWLLKRQRQYDLGKPPYEQDLDPLIVRDSLKEQELAPQFTLPHLKHDAMTDLVQRRVNKLFGNICSAEEYLTRSRKNVPAPKQLYLYGGVLAAGTPEAGLAGCRAVLRENGPYYNWQMVTWQLHGKEDLWEFLTHPDDAAVADKIELLPTP